MPSEFDLARLNPRFMLRNHGVLRQFRPQLVLESSEIWHNLFSLFQLWVTLFFFFFVKHTASPLWKFVIHLKSCREFLSNLTTSAQIRYRIACFEKFSAEQALNRGVRLR